MPNMSIDELEKLLHRNPEVKAPGYAALVGAMPVEEARERMMAGLAPKHVNSRCATDYAPLEAHEQAAVIEWAQWHETTYPCLKLLLHVPNGGKRDAATGAMLKAQGVKAGVPDLLLLCPAGAYGGLAIEMKRANGVFSDVSAEQDWWNTELKYVGWEAHVCFGAAAAIEVLENYCMQVLAYKENDE